MLRGGGWHKASVLGCLPLAAPIGLSPLLILTLCGSERILVVSTEPPDDLSCFTIPGVGRLGDGLLPVPLTRCIQMHPFLPTPAPTCVHWGVHLRDHFPDRGWGWGGGGVTTTGLRERGNNTSRSTGRSGRQKAATRRNMRREERVTVQGPVKEQQSDGMSRRGVRQRSPSRHSGPSSPRVTVSRGLPGCATARDVCLYIALARARTRRVTGFER